MNDSDRAPASLAFAPGHTLGAYVIERVIGEGASGTVYSAKTAHGDRVALKVVHRHLLADRQIFGRFRREAAILKRLEGHHLAKLLDFVEEGELLAIVLEYAPGISLEAMLEKRAPIGLEDAVEITLQVCAALGAAHAAGVIHRDLKPANVLVESAEEASDGSAPGEIHVRVVDFGLAKVVHGDHATTGLTEQDMIFGTPEYMAPEQARGDEVDVRCDLYAAGIMLYEMAVGKVPFRDRSPIATMTAHLTEEPPPPRSSAPGRQISPALEAVIFRALAKEREDRYASARAFAEALSAARDEPLVIAPAAVADPISLGEGDTDLHLVATGLGHSTTLPPDELDVSAATERQPGEKRRWLWAIVAIVAAVIGVAIGALAGSR